MASQDESLQPILPLNAQKFKLSTRAGRNKRYGVAALEFAVIAPILVTLILAIIEFGQVLMIYQVMTDSAREGARTAVLPGSQTSDVYSAIYNTLNGTVSVKNNWPTSNGTTTWTLQNSSGSNIGSVTITDTSGNSLDPGTAATGTAIKVTVSINFSAVSWTAPLFSISSNLTTNITMRKESNGS